MVTNYLKTRSFQEVQQLFEQRFRDRVSLTKMTNWKNVIKYKTEGSSLILDKNSLNHRRTERTEENIEYHQKSLSRSKNISKRKWFGH